MWIEPPGVVLFEVRVHEPETEVDGFLSLIERDQRHVVALADQFESDLGAARPAADVVHRDECQHQHGMKVDRVGSHGGRTRPRKWDQTVRVAGVANPLEERGQRMLTWWDPSDLLEDGAANGDRARAHGWLGTSPVGDAWWVDLSRRHRPQPWIGQEPNCQITNVLRCREGGIDDHLDVVTGCPGRTVEADPVRVRGRVPPSARLPRVEREDVDVPADILGMLSHPDPGHQPVRDQRSQDLLQIELHHWVTSGIKPASSGGCRCTGMFGSSISPGTDHPALGTNP